jgi:ABC-type antimicrobial peptide transport system permease subunit
MPGIAELAMAGAPIAGGALLGLAAGSFKGTDMRAVIKQDMELLEKIPPEQVERRAELQRVIDMRIDDLVSAVDKNREIRELATSYQGNWRDVVVFICTILFAIIWWNVSHSRSNWLLMFIVMIVLCLVAGIYAARGLLRAFATYAQSRRRATKTQ